LKILKTLGSGQFGNVFLAYDELLDEMYAVKSINKNTEDEEQQIKIIVERERNILSMINHPFI
jgi:serine/threonine protein kinase